MKLTTEGKIAFALRNLVNSDKAAEILAKLTSDELDFVAKEIRDAFAYRARNDIRRVLEKFHTQRDQLRAFNDMAREPEDKK
jgi:hypothetical protein